MSKTTKQADKFDVSKMGKITTITFTKGDDCFVVPYSHFKKEIHGNQICLVDPNTDTLLSITRVP